ncbi:hypothetical protein LJ737_03180 [Hymenobacter sp. 15J16-1T3B]|uniref:hypothetical protein n=1 Tax=Hymenobacter sp. 15J16-1T3B TaxID=2886941 RepID=UPI001D1294DE|nr:hypothetical protein [Hymenobacter sp. 15J16-1T3B]MCC3156221.1 hypothetical protein [Hymenobacter sp. 15J16-1T3B]
MLLLILWTSLVRLCGEPTAPARPELFPGEQQLNSCALDLPLTYLKKDMPAAVRAARAHQNEPLVLVSYNPQTHQISAQRVFVRVFTQAKTGKEVIYQEAAAEQHLPSGARKGLFTRLNPQTDRYYRAACFDETVAATPALQQLLQPTAATNALGR